MTTLVHQREHYLRINRTFHVCKAIGRAFTQRQWWAYLKEREGDSNSAVATINGYQYNICDVCLNPTVECYIEFKKSFLKVKYAVMPDGRFRGGYDWNILTSGGCSGVGFREIGDFDSKNALVTHYLEIYERHVKEQLDYLKRSQQYDDDGNEVSSTPSIQICKHMLKEIEDKKDYYHPNQLSLFEL